MATFKDLPDDIVISITNYAAADIEKGLQKWKPALYMLGISKQWRALAKAIVFRYGYIEEALPSHKNKLSVLTNLPLACHSASTHYVKTLSVAHKAVDSADELLLSISIATNSKWPNIRQIRFFSRFASYSLSTRALTCEQCKYVNTLAELFVNSFPYIRTLDISATRADSLYHEFIVAVINRILPTLDHFAYNGALFALQSCTNNYLKTADLNFTNHLDKAPIAINPEPLQKLNLGNIGPNYAWNQFLAPKQTDSITFTNLQTCMLSNMGLPSLSMPSHESQVLPGVKPQTLRFPKLHSLTLCGEWPPNARIKSMLSFPLERLELQWWLPDFDLLDIPHLHFLGCIKVRYTLDANSQNSAFFDRTNQLMRRIKGVGSVQFILYSVSESLLWQQAQWPHLTALHMDLCADIYYVLSLLSRFPHLHQFKMCRLLDANGCSDKSALLAKLQIKQPPNSSLEKFVLGFRPHLADEALDANLQLLWWYFPQLKMIDIPLSCL